MSYGTSTARRRIKTELRGLGASIEAEGDLLRVDAPAGIVTEELHDDPTTGEWHEVKASECLPGVVETANTHRKKEAYMPLTTAEIYAKLGVKEGRPLYLLALVSDEDGSFQGYGATLPKWVDGKEVPTEHGRVLYAFTSVEKAEEFAKQTSWRDPNPAYPKVVYDWSDWGKLPDEGPAHVEPAAADLREIAYAVAYFSHHHTLAIDAGPTGQGRYIPLEDLRWSRDLVEVYRGYPAATHIDRFFGETADEAERAFREGRAVDNHSLLRHPPHLFEHLYESADEDSI